MKILYLSVGQRKPLIEMSITGSISVIRQLIGAAELKQTLFYCFGKPVRVFYDGNRLNQPPIISVFSVRDERTVSGNVVLVGEEKQDGTFAGLTDEEIKNIRSCTMLSQGYYFLMLK